MAQPKRRAAHTLTANVELGIGSSRIKVSAEVPAGLMPVTDLLPIAQSITNQVVAIGVRNAEAAGKQIWCCKGCGACCRQLVPVTEPEAHRLGDLVDNLPADRRTEIQHRFAAARTKLEASGLLQRLLDREQLSKTERTSLGLDYFRQGIPCPFLEDESCSIHPDRPLACREYLVTSPAINCAHPTRDTVQCVELPAKVSNVVAQLSSGGRTATPGWVPLILAPEWSREHPPAPPASSGPDLLRDFFGLFGGGTKAS